MPRLENGGGARKGIIATSDLGASLTLNESKRKGRWGGSVLDCSAIEGMLSETITGWSPYQTGKVRGALGLLGTWLPPHCCSVIGWEQLRESWSLHTHEGEFRAAAGTLGMQSQDSLMDAISGHHITFPVAHLCPRLLGDSKLASVSAFSYCCPKKLPQTWSFKTTLFFFFLTVL